MSQTERQASFPAVLNTSKTQTSATKASQICSEPHAPG